MSVSRVILHDFVVLSWLFFKINLFKKLFQEHYQGVKQFGSRSGPTFCRSWSGFKLFAKVISADDTSEELMAVFFLEKWALALSLTCILSSIYSKAHGRKYETLYIGHPSSNSSNVAAIHGYSLRVIKVGLMKCARSGFRLWDIAVFHRQQTGHQLGTHWLGLVTNSGSETLQSSAASRRASNWAPTD